jgi:hypothetical protein
MGLTDLFRFIKRRFPKAWSKLPESAVEGNTAHERAIFIDVISMITGSGDHHGTDRTFDGKPVILRADIGDNGNDEDPAAAAAGNEEDEDVEEGGGGGGGGGGDAAVAELKARAKARGERMAERIAANRKENISADDESYKPNHLSVDDLVNRTLHLLGRLVDARGGSSSSLVTAIWLGCDMHTNVPLIKQKEWWVRDSQGWRTRVDGKSSDAYLWTFSLSEEMLCFNPVAVATTDAAAAAPLGITFTRADPIPMEMLLDRLLRPVWVSLIFDRVFTRIGENVNVPAALHEAVTRRGLEIRLLHPIIRFDKRKYFFHDPANPSAGMVSMMMPGAGGGGGIDKDAEYRHRQQPLGPNLIINGKRGYDTLGFHVGEADNQGALFMHYMRDKNAKKLIHFEFHTNDSDVICISLLQMLSVISSIGLGSGGGGGGATSDGLRDVKITVWAMNCRYEIAKLAVQMVQLLSGTKEGEGVGMDFAAFAKTVVGNIILWLIICKNDFCPEYAGLSPLLPGEARDPEMKNLTMTERALEKTTRLIRQNRQTLLVQLRDCAKVKFSVIGQLRPVSIEFDIFGIMRICLLVRLLGMVPAEQIESVVLPIVTSSANFLSADATRAFQRDDLHQQWHNFIDKCVGDGSRGQSYKSNVASFILGGLVSRPTRDLFIFEDNNADNVEQARHRGIEVFAQMLSFDEFHALVERVEMTNTHSREAVINRRQGHRAARPAAMPSEDIGKVPDAGIYLNVVFYLDTDTSKRIGVTKTRIADQRFMQGVLNMQSLPKHAFTGEVYRRPRFKALDHQPFPGDLHPQALFQKACLVAWTITYWYAGHFTAFATGLPLLKAPPVPHQKPDVQTHTHLIIEAHETNQCLQLYELAGFKPQLAQIRGSESGPVLRSLIRYPFYDDPAEEDDTRPPIQDGDQRRHWWVKDVPFPTFEGSDNNNKFFITVNLRRLVTVAEEASGALYIQSLVVNIPLHLHFDPIPTTTTTNRRRGIQQQQGKTRDEDEEEDDEEEEQSARNEDDRETMIMAALDRLLITHGDELTGLLLDDENNEGLQPFVDTRRISPVTKLEFMKRFCEIMIENDGNCNEQLAYIEALTTAVLAPLNNTVVDLLPIDENSPDLLARLNLFNNAPEETQPNVFPDNISIRSSLAAGANSNNNNNNNDNGSIRLALAAEPGTPIPRMAMMLAPMSIGTPTRRTVSIARLTHHPSALNPQTSVELDYLHHSEFLRPTKIDKFTYTAPEYMIYDAETASGIGRNQQLTLTTSYLPLHSETYRGACSSCVTQARVPAEAEAEAHSLLAETLPLHFIQPAVVMANLASVMLPYAGRITSRENAMIARRKRLHTQAMRVEPVRIVRFDVTEEELGVSQQAIRITLSHIAGILSPNHYVRDYALHMLAEDAHRYFPHSWRSVFCLYASIFGAFAEISFLSFINWKIKLSAFMATTKFKEHRVRTQLRAQYRNIRLVMLDRADPEFKIALSNRPAMTWPFAFLLRDGTLRADVLTKITNAQHAQVIDSLVKVKYGECIRMLSSALPSVRNLYISISHDAKTIKLYFLKWQPITALHYIEFNGGADVSRNNEEDADDSIMLPVPAPSSSSSSSSSGERIKYSILYYLVQ